MLINQNVLALGQKLVQEDGAQPGRGLSILKAIIYFGVAPVGLFLLITAGVLLSTVKKKKISVAVDRID